MEVISSIASVLSVAEASLNIAGKTRRLTRSYREAHQAVCMVEQQFNILREIVDGIQPFASQINDDLNRTTITPLESTVPLVRSLDMLSAGLESLKSAYSRKSERPFTAKDRFRWAFREKSLVDEAQKTLEAARSILTLCLQSSTLIHLMSHQSFVAKALQEQRTLRVEIEEMTPILSSSDECKIFKGKSTQSNSKGTTKAFSCKATQANSALLDQDFSRTKPTKDGKEAQCEVFIPLQCLPTERDQGIRLISPPNIKSNKVNLASSYTTLFRSGVTCLYRTLPALGTSGGLSVTWDECSVHYSLYMQVHLPRLLGKGLLICSLSCKHYRLARLRISLQSCYIGISHYVPWNSEIFQAIETGDETLLRLLLNGGSAGPNDRFPVHGDKEVWWRGETTILAVCPTNGTQ